MLYGQTRPIDVTSSNHETFLDQILNASDTSIYARNLPAFLEQIKSYYGLASLAYLAMNVPGLTDHGPYFRCTYPEEWVEHYIDNDYVKIDPVLIQGTNSLLPFDWESIQRDQTSIQAFFSEAAGAGIGNHGLTIPVRGRFGELALVSLSSDVNQQDWQKDRLQYMRDFQILALFLHQAIMEFEKIGQRYDPLSPRETECLKWLARGKTVDDISVILGISRHTVRAYSDTARTKLNGLNITHAVARAVSLKLIDGPD